MLPRRRRDRLVVEELADETLVYDLDRHKGHCLNRVASLVWQHCDGKTGVAAMAGRLHEELGAPADESIVWCALDQLHKAHLLAEAPGLEGEETRRPDRRQLMKQLAACGLATAMVLSITVPVAAAHASSTLPNGHGCTRSSQCLSNCCVNRGGSFVCADPRRRVLCAPG